MTRSATWLLRTSPVLAVLLAAAYLSEPARVVAVPAPEDEPPPAVEPAHFHHVHLNVMDPARTQAYYEKYFGANPVKFRDRSDALFTERSFILLHKVDRPPRDNFGTTLWHIGWAGVDGASEFAWRTKEGIEVQTPITPLGSQFYMYFWGPDHELVEVYTGSRNHRFEHVHLVPSNIDATLKWFHDNLGLDPNGPTRNWSQGGSMRTNTIRVDNVNIIMFEATPPGAQRPDVLPAAAGAPFDVTDGRAMDHIAFSYLDIAPVFERMRAAGVQIVHPIAVDPETGLRSFFVRGPDGLLVEIVQEKPIPEGIWR